MLFGNYTADSAITLPPRITANELKKQFDAHMQGIGAFEISMAAFENRPPYDGPCVGNEFRKAADMLREAIGDYEPSRAAKEMIESIYYPGNGFFFKNKLAMEGYVSERIELIELAINCGLERSDAFVRSRGATNLEEALIVLRELRETIRKAPFHLTKEEARELDESCKPLKKNRRQA